MLRPFLFHLQYPARRLAISKTLFGNRLYASEVSISIEQVEQCRVGRPKLAHERIELASQSVRDLLRVLMQTGGGDNEANAIATQAPSGSSGHLLCFGTRIEIVSSRLPFVRQRQIGQLYERENQPPRPPLRSRRLRPTVRRSLVFR